MQYLRYGKPVVYESED